MYKVKFADIGEGLTEGKVVEVLVKIGDQVKAGDSLFYVETDKVNSEIPAPISGKIAKINIQPDQEIKVGEVVMEIEDGVSDSAAKPIAQTKAAPNQEAVEENASVVGSTPVSNDLLPSRKPNDSQKKLQKESPEPEKTIQPINYDYDVIIIGAGVGGYTAAIKAAQLNLKTLVIEKENYGGVCLNVGCIPTKTLLKSSEVYHQTTHGLQDLGIELSKNAKVNVNWKNVQKRKEAVVEKLTNGVRYLLNKNKIDHFVGTAEVLDAHKVQVGTKTYTTNDLILATGSLPKTLNLPGFEQAQKNGFLINSTSALSLPVIPKKLVIIGGGVIGVEFACLYSNFGTEVTILQGLPTILEMFDRDIAQEMTKILIDKYKVKIIHNAQIKGIEGHEVLYSVDGKDQKIAADYCLESVGRAAVTTPFKQLSLELDQRGFVKTNDFAQTNLVNVYAIGDLNGKMMLAHVASHEGLVAAHHIDQKRHKKETDVLSMNYEIIPSCIYSHPEIAVIGKTEAECQKANLDYKTYKFPFSAIGKALVDGTPQGFVKIIVEKPYGKIIGAHMLGNRATDMIAEIAAVIESEGTIDELARTIHPHPTMSEAIGETAEALVFGKPINF